jgi:pimeloyl-ACP methyl ester carboxylesterase
MCAGLALILVAQAAAMAPKRILALHGKGQTAASFRQRIGPLLDRLDGSVEVTCIDAPWEIGGGGQWWKLPPGVRSYEAREYEGVDRSLEILANEFALGDVVGVIGYSQGGILLSFFLAANLQLRLSGQPALVPRKALIIGAAWPNPYTGVMESLKKIPQEGRRALGCELLHVIGQDDNVNPPEQALAISKCFGDASTVHKHGGKHIVPLDDESLTIMSEFLLQAAQEAGPAAEAQVTGPAAGAVPRAQATG